MRRGFTWKLNAMNTKKNGRAADTGATRTANRRAFAPNRKTPMRRVWTLAHIPANARAAIDREAAKWGISTGDAIARIMRRELAAHERAEGRGALYHADILGKGVAA